MRLGRNLILREGIGSNVMDTVIQRLEEFTKTYSLDRLPKLTSNNPQEKEDAQWLVDMLEAKAGIGYKRWYPVLDEIATSIGWSGIFDVLTDEDKAIEHFRQIVGRYSLNNNE